MTNENKTADYQRAVCSTIYDTSDVLKSQLVSSVNEMLSEKIDTEDMKNIKESVDSVVSTQINSLVDRVVKVLS